MPDAHEAIHSASPDHPGLLDPVACLPRRPTPDQLEIGPRIAAIEERHDGLSVFRMSG
jgi:hypothetical protein